MFLKDTDGILFEITAAEIKDMKTRHGIRGDFTSIVTHDNQIFNVEESVPYIMKLIAMEKSHENGRT